MKTGEIENLNILEQNQVKIEVRDLYKSFDDNHVLRGVNVDVKQGENVVVLGKSGSGKSVLIKCIIGLIDPDRGKIMAFGEDLLKMDGEQMNKIRMRMGFLFQSNALYDSLTIRENLEFPLRRLRMSLSRAEVEKAVDDALSSVGLLHTKDYMPSALSGGMKKRVSIARTLIMNPDIILYDEPTTGLDPVTAREISSLILQVREKYNTSSIIISHDMGCIKMVADRIVVLRDGVNYAEGTYEELQNSKDEYVKAFFI